MTMPFYVSPEQVMKDRADYARKGIARGRSLVAMSAVEGIVIVAENPSRTLYKISEIYDRIAFAGVGKYNEFEMLRIAGVRQADMKGYSFAREDVNARSLANAYAQTLGQVFTHEMKPYEIEILVAQVGTGPADDELFHILYDGTVMDEEGSTVLGGQADTIAEVLGQRYQADLTRDDAVRLGAEVLAGDGEALAAGQLEVAFLDRTKERRAFQRLRGPELDATPERRYASIGQQLGDEVVRERSRRNV
jgi:proteasome alpha subunit